MLAEARNSPQFPCLKGRGPIETPGNDLGHVIAGLISMSERTWPTTPPLTLPEYPLPLPRPSQERDKEAPSLSSP